MCSCTPSAGRRRQLLTDTWQLRSLCNDDPNSTAFVIHTHSSVSHRLEITFSTIRQAQIVVGAERKDLVASREVDLHDGDLCMAHIDDREVAQPGSLVHEFVQTTAELDVQGCESGVCGIVGRSVASSSDRRGLEAIWEFAIPKDVEQVAIQVGVSIQKDAGRSADTTTNTICVRKRIVRFLLGWLHVGVAACHYVLGPAQVKRAAAAGSR